MAIADTETHKRRLEETRKRWESGKSTVVSKPRKKRSQIRVTSAASEEVAAHLVLRLRAKQFCERNCDLLCGVHHFMCLVTLWNDDAGRKLVIEQAD